MSEHSRPGKTPSNLSIRVEHSLRTYALVASAAGVSLLALTEPAEARVVYTKVRQAIGKNGIYPIDLNHDGTVDFVVSQRGYNSCSNQLLAKGAFGNGVEGSKFSAAALTRGAIIGSRQRFSNRTSWGELMAGFARTESGRCPSSGQWINVSNRYLGLGFQLNGKTHYGWARLSTQTQRSGTIATLTGYAYETVPGKPIRAGQTSGEIEQDVSTLDQGGQAPAPDGAIELPAHSSKRQTLGELATGAPGRESGRRP